jgi:hypothetical protein
MHFFVGEREKRKKSKYIEIFRLDPLDQRNTIHNNCGGTLLPDLLWQ